MPNLKKFSTSFSFLNLSQHKNEAVSLICSEEIDYLKILQFDWLRVFWYKSQRQDFSQILDLWRSTANNMNFYYRTKSVRINDQISQ